jgi:hypothetical protein
MPFAVDRHSFEALVERKPAMSRLKIIGACSSSLREAALAFRGSLDRQHNSLLDKQLRIEVHRENQRIQYIYL